APSTSRPVIPNFPTPTPAPAPTQTSSPAISSSL
ncbi:N-acetylmuramoyl-L-alanine amidase, partial [Mycobacteroides abscessus subsp. abscessus]|nr:N-acetylmuramoyl-L-alanine amidase [Mycobacteroides abscessus subsp. abscessus]